MRGFRSFLLGLALTLGALSTASAQTMPDVGFGGLGAGFVNLPLNQGGLDRDMATDMKIRPDGRIVIAGLVQTATGVVAGVYQLTADGLPDPSFGGGDGRATFIDPTDPTANLVVYCLALQSDGKIVLAGQTPSALGRDHPFAFVMRINADGTALDPSFDGDGMATPRADDYRDVAIASDGRIVLAGTLTLHWLAIPPAPGYDTDRIAVTRLLANGALDPSFDGDGEPYFHFGTDEFIKRDFRGRALALATDGRILVAAEIWTPDHGTDFGVLGLRQDGTPDPTFGNYGPSGQARVHFDQTGSDCTEDFVTDIGFYSSALAPAANRIVLAGHACLSDGNREFAVARLFANGELDVDFADTGRRFIGFDLGGNNGDYATALAFQSPGGYFLGLPPSHVVVAGLAVRTGSNYDIALARLRLSDGVLDSSFGNGGRYVFPIDLGGPLTEYVEAVATTPSKITIAGWISTPLNDGSDRDFLAARFVVDETLFRNGFE
jgi:uncharacterized delta-60 repeat protein